MRKFLFFTGMLVFVMACSSLQVPTLTQSATPPPTQAPAKVDMTARLDELGGVPCDENPEFTCVTIQVPLDHFDTANPEKIDVVFAVSPAQGDRYGMFIQAFPGGPGGEGISTGGLTWFSDGILEHYDIVFFDQRGIGLSSPLSCPDAYAKDFLNYLTQVDTAGQEGYDTPAEQQAAIEEARTYVEGCVAEIGIEPAKLNFYGTNQVAEDLDSFREVIGDQKVWMYGVSYGTAVAETYAYAHPDRLAGLVLDGTINKTLSGEEGALSQEKAFDKVLVAVLKSCNEDPSCAADMGKEAVAAYDDLAAAVSRNPIKYQFPLPSGRTVGGTFTFNQLEFTTAYQMYSLSGRMLYLRALAAAVHGDIIPMTRLMYNNTTIDPETFTYLGDPTFSDTMFLGVLCTDDSYFSGTQEERIAKTIEAGQASNGTVPRLDGSVYTGLDCAFWPSSPKEVVKRAPLVLQGVPTFVLNATLDPATPFEEGKFVYEHLADGYHLYVEGGRHSIYGWGFDCPDKYITDFLVDGTLPTGHEILCKDWGTDVTRAYEPLISGDISTFADPLEAFSAVDGSIQLQPEYFYSYFDKDTSVACPFGGSFTFGPSDTGEAHTYENCAYIKGFVLSGSGSYDYSSGVFTIDAQISGAKQGHLVYTINAADGSSSVTGDYGGEKIDLSK